MRLNLQQRETYGALEGKLVEVASDTYRPNAGPINEVVPLVVGIRPAAG